MRTKSTYIFGLLILVSTLTIGCGDDDPGPEPTQVGAVTINPEPNSINASWQITGPGGFTQSSNGDLTLADMTAGSYTLTWGAVTGWTTPSPAAVTQSLAAGGTLTFTGTYLAQAGTITINPEPNSINASWQITGPNAFSQSGNGDLTLADMTAGSYTLTWGAVVGWTTPNPAAITQTMATNGTLTFTGTYVAQAGTITINPEPNSINASWQITGPGGFTGSAHGDTTLANMTAGSYTLTWDAVSGWTSPNPASVTGSLAADGTLTFTGVYIEDTEVPSGFVSIPAGTFTMGSPADEPGRWDGETQHQVTLTHGIYVQTTEVTNQQYAELAQWAYDHGYATVAADTSLHDALDGSTQHLLDLASGHNEISFSGGMFTVEAGKADHPVMYVTWYGSVAYCDWLSLQQGLPRAYNHATWQCNGGNPYTAAGYRLPTEAEWEYACRAGSTTAFANGPITQIDCDPIDPNLDLMGWYCGNANGWTHPVARKLPNAWGLYDMHGNVWEWCNDRWGNYGGTVTDPAGPGAGSNRVIRGGLWGINAQVCRSANRDYFYPIYANYFIGFRLVRSS
jgi:formylglycine-generating enzyme required for sulfatase activity